MQDFFTIAKTDFLDTFQGAWIFPLLLIVLVFIFWKEKDDMQKTAAGCAAAVVFIYLLVSADWDAVHEAAG